MVVINEKLCKGCLICVEFCPKNVLSLNKLQKATVKNSENCISCGLCELRCPDYAITVRK